MIVLWKLMLKKNLNYIYLREQTTFSWLLIAGFNMLMFDAVRMKQRALKAYKD